MKASFIPPSPTGGILPYWMLLISSAAFYNVAQSYVVLWQTKEIYGKKPEQGMSFLYFLELMGADDGHCSYEQIVGYLEFTICHHQVQSRL